MAKPAKIPGIKIEAKWDGEGIRLHPNGTFDEPSGLRLMNTSDKTMYIKSVNYKKADIAGVRTSPVAEMTQRKVKETDGKQKA